MTSGERVSTFQHLADLDRLLREVQVELAPGREPPPALEPDDVVPDPGPPEPPPPPDPGVPEPGPAEPGPPEPPPPEPGPPEPPPEPGPPEPPPPPPAEPPPPPDPGVPEPPPPPPVPAPALGATGDIRAAAAMSRHLLAAIRELLAGYERVLSEPSMARPARRPRTIPDWPDATVSAGPFPTVEAVRAFETELSRLPGVRDVALRAYEGTDRALIDVRLT